MTRLRGSVAPAAGAWIGRKPGRCKQGSGEGGGEDEAVGTRGAPRRVDGRSGQLQHHWLRGSGASSWTRCSSDLADEGALALRFDPPGGQSVRTSRKGRLTYPRSQLTRPPGVLDLQGRAEGRAQGRERSRWRTRRPGNGRRCSRRHDGFASMEPPALLRTPK